ncbi:hypothetical protein Ancab_008423 [Ancistrocladus abbreviatus]
MKRNQFHSLNRVPSTPVYMDPKLIVTGELTDKSNAYGFVLVLLELLTGKKPPYTAKHSLRNFEKGNLCEILDEKIVSEKTAVWLEAVAYDARVCLRMRGEGRPTMREVENELKGIMTGELHLWSNYGLVAL